MRAINHTVTGAVVGAAIGNPWVALPTAFLSHFVLDVIPHSGDKRMSQKSLRFKLELALDCTLSASFLLMIILLQPVHWQVLLACGMAGAAPDLLWFPYWVWELRGTPRQKGTLGKFLGWIQWSETPRGYFIEGIWLIAVLYAFFAITA